MLIKIKSFLADLVFPVCCCACRREGDWLCRECTEKIHLNQKQYCPICWRRNLGGQICRSCAGHSALSGLRVAASYEKNPELAEAVKTLKYKFSESLAENLGKILIKAVQQKDYLNERIVIPVPLHKKRERWRGFNQAELLAKAVAKGLDLPCELALCRVRNTPQQAKLPRADRLKNLEKAFQLAPRGFVKDKTVLLVDDVATTGATLQECAKTLRLAGAKEVWGLVLARG